MTSMMFAPGCLRTMMETLRLPSAQAATRSFSTLSRTRATSERRTIESLRTAMGMFLYWAASKS
jgi:hypothetical protein